MSTCRRRASGAASAPSSSPSGDDAGEGGGHEAEERQGRVAAADVGRVLEGGAGTPARRRARRAPSPGRWWRRSSRGRGGRPRSARGGCGSRSSCPTSTRRGTACAPSGHSLSTRATAAGWVVSSTSRSRRSGRRAEGAGEHLGEQRRAAHAEHDDPLEPVLAAGVGELEQAGHLVRASSRWQSSQPSRSATSVGSSCQSVWSRRCRRLTALARRARSATSVVDRSTARGPSSSVSSTPRRVYPRSSTAAPAASRRARRRRRRCGRGPGRGPRRRPGARATPRRAGRGRSAA